MPATRPLRTTKAPPSMSSSAKTGAISSSKSSQSMFRPSAHSAADSSSYSFNKDLYRLIKSGKISKADGLRFAPNMPALEMNLEGIFIKS